MRNIILSDDAPVDAVPAARSVYGNLYGLVMMFQFFNMQYSVSIYTFRMFHSSLYSEHCFNFQFYFSEFKPPNLRPLPRSATWMPLGIESIPEMSSVSYTVDLDICGN